MIARKRVWLAVAMAGLVVACSKGGGGGGAGGGNVTAEAASALDFMPKDTSVAFGINVGKLKDNKYYTKLVDGMTAEAKEQLAHAKQTCGLDWQNDFESVIVAMGGNMDKERAVVLVKGNWDHDKLAKCAVAVSEKEGKKVTVSKDGELTLVQVEGEKPAYLAWPAKGTVMGTAASLKGDKVLLTDLLKKATTVKDNKTFVSLLSSVDTTAGAWVVGQVPDQEAASFMEQINPGGKQKLLGGYGNLNLTKDLKVSVGLRLDSDPKGVADKLNAKLEDGRKNLPPQYADMAKDISITPSANDVIIKIGLTEAQLDQLAGMVGGMLPMMMGGGFGGGDEPPPTQQ